MFRNKQAALVKKTTNYFKSLKELSEREKKMDFDEKDGDYKVNIGVDQDDVSSGSGGESSYAWTK